MLIYRCQGFFALTTFGTFLAGPVKSLIGFSFFYCLCIYSVCPSAFLAVHRSVWISICSAGLPACCSAWSARSSVCLEVCSIACLFIWLHLAAGLVAYQSAWQSVCSSACSGGCSSCCSFWCPFCSSVNLVICRSVLLPAGCNFVHLPVPQARCQSVSSSANPGRL